MPDPMHTLFAQTLVNYSLGIKEGDLLLVQSSTLAVPLVAEVYRAAMGNGANVVHRLTFEGQEDIILGAASDAQLDWPAPIEKYEMETVSARLTIGAPFNTRASSGLSPTRAARFMRARHEIGAIQRRRAAAGELRWCMTQFPAHAAAQEADMSKAAYERFVYSAMFLDQPDPAAAWMALSEDQQRKVAALNNVKTLRILAPDTDLTLSVAGRKWINSDGKRNFPSGEIFTGPIEDSASGTIRFTYPAVHGGRSVDDARLWFEKGRVVRAEAAQGLDYLEAMMDSDPGARFLGEVAIGNNYAVRQFTRNTLFDEKIGGTCHIALGASYPDTGGLNESALHWDMVCDLRSGGEIHADGRVIHRNGAWMI